MPQGNTYPAPQLPLNGTETLTMFQQQGGSMVTCTVTLEQIATFFGGDGSLTVPGLTALLLELPTTLPTTPGALWMNGGVLTLTNGGTPTYFNAGVLSQTNLTLLLLSLVATLPMVGGVIWLDGGGSTTASGGMLALTSGGIPDTYTYGTLSIANMILLMLSLPTTLPTTVETLWVNDGVLTLTN